MTIEQVELRKMLSQMLADNGINRETIRKMVEDIISEKVEKAVKEVFTSRSENIEEKAQRKLNVACDKYVSENVNQAFKAALTRVVNSYEFRVTIENKDKNCERWA